MKKLSIIGIVFGIIAVITSLIAGNSIILVLGLLGIILNCIQLKNE
ncbi:TPA: hypothetical protein PTV97_003769 [Clostridium botulinum]|nr:hypothetical protein [Clostridium botulinum]